MKGKEEQEMKGEAMKRQKERITDREERKEKIAGGKRRSQRRGGCRAERRNGISGIRKGKKEEKYRK